MTTNDAMPPADLVYELAKTLTAPGQAFEVVDEDVRGHRMPVFADRFRSLGEIVTASRRFGDRVFIVDGDRRVTFTKHADAVDAIAHALRSDFDVGRGDRVALFAANSWEWVTAFWGIVAAGAIPVAMNSWWTADEYLHAAGLVEPRLVVADRRRRDVEADSGSQVPVVDLHEKVAAITAAAGRTTPIPIDVAEDDPGVIIFTSGTTGRPKAATIPHRGVVGFGQQYVLLQCAGRTALGGRRPARGVPVEPFDEVMLITSPLFHVSMLYGGVLLAMLKGSSIVLLPGRFDPERVVETIASERVTSWMALGSAATRVANLPDVHRYDTSSIRYLAIGGAPVSPAVQERLRAAFPDSPDSLAMGYTSTEAGGVVAAIGSREFADHPTSTGQIAPTVAIELRDHQDTTVPAGVEGEVHVRSAYTMLGYWNDEASSAAVLKPGGWLATGDIARLEGGLLYINSRARDMILVSAENVSPTEVEHALEAHEAVVEAAVLAVDDEITGDAVCGVVNVGGRTDLSSDVLAAWCRDRLAHYKVPTKWHLVAEPLPRTPTGKLVKSTIRRWVDAGSAGPFP